MRLWSIHPKYLDTKGLVALWREALLAQRVLEKGTKGYKNHPQLIRFRKHPTPLKAISNYLIGVWEESRLRGYRFDRMKIGNAGSVETIPVSEGQLLYEFNRLVSKLRERDPVKFRELLAVQRIECHPIFHAIEGEIEVWEKGKI